MRFLKIIIIIIVFIIAFCSYQIVTTGFIISDELDESQNLFFIYKKFRYPSNVTISYPATEIALGISIDTDNLNFGIIPSGGSYGTRIINIKNDEDVPIKIKLKPFGDISPMIDFEVPEFILQKGEEKKIEIYLRTTEATRMGNYTGGVEILSIRPKIDAFSSLLQLI